MLRFNRVVCVVLLCSLAAVAFAGARKIRFLTVVRAPADADGMAILSYSAEEDKTIVQIMLTDFDVNTSYDWALSDDVNTAQGLASLVTDDKGKAHLHYEVPDADVSGYCLYIYTDIEHPTETLQAYGCPY